MKKIIYGALAMTLTFGTISCSDFLELQKTISSVVKPE